MEVWDEKKIGRLVTAAKIVNIQMEFFTELRYGIILILSPGDHCQFLTAISDLRNIYLFKTGDTCLCRNHLLANFFSFYPIHNS